MGVAVEIARVEEDVACVGLTETPLERALGVVICLDRDALLDECAAFHDPPSSVAVALLGVVGRSSMRLGSIWVVQGLVVV